MDNFNLRTAARHITSHAYGRSLLALKAATELAALLSGEDLTVGTLTLTDGTVGGDQIAGVESGTYTPTLLQGFSVATFSPNTANYSFVGGPASGDKGILTINARHTFDSAPTSSGVEIQFSLPSGFTLNPTWSGITIVGQVLLFDTSTPANSVTWSTSAYTDKVRFLNTLGTIAATGVAPFTFANGDSIGWSATSVATRT